MTVGIQADSNPAQPPLLQDRSFWGLNLTQFLGAFNDNLFKQLVMLLCLDQVNRGGSDLQGIGLILFAAPFIAISGYAGFLSDRYSKRSIIVLCKVAEVGIILLGSIGFALNNLYFLLAILCLMGVHSAFFGPSKYGILPEMLRQRDLPQANGMMLMATFLAIIFGLSAAGAAKHALSDMLWMASLPCVITAIVGLVCSFSIRPTPIAQPNLKFDLSSIAIAQDTRQLLLRDRKLLLVLLMSSVFWFVGGTIYPPAINAFCKEQLRLDDLYTGIFAASTGVGIAIGCVGTGLLSKDRVRGIIVRIGAWGITLSLVLLALPGPGWNEVRKEQLILKQQRIAKVVVPANPRQAADNPETDAADDIELAKAKDAAQGQERLNPEKQAQLYYRGTLLGPYLSAIALVSVGLFAGMFSVPLQVYLQSMSPSDQKGRIIGANNLLNWIGIATAGAIYHVGRMILVDAMMLPHATLFGFAALLMLPVALFYRPPEAEVITTN